MLRRVEAFWYVFRFTSVLTSLNVSVKTVTFDAPREFLFEICFDFICSASDLMGHRKISSQSVHEFDCNGFRFDLFPFINEESQLNLFLTIIKLLISQRVYNTIMKLYLLLYNHLVGYCNLYLVCLWSFSSQYFPRIHLGFRSAIDLGGTREVLCYLLQISSRSYKTVPI